jgi:Lipocalin-like domain
MNTVQGSDVLVGGWRLVSWENRAADDQVSYPMGTDALGYVLYTADGRFSVTISRRDRAGFAVGDLLGGTTEEQARAWRALSPTRAATASMATASSIMWSCRCSPTGLAATRSGGSSLPGTG